MVSISTQCAISVFNCKDNVVLVEVWLAETMIDASRFRDGAKEKANQPAIPVASSVVAGDQMSTGEDQTQRDAPNEVAVGALPKSNSRAVAFHSRPRQQVRRVEAFHGHSAISETHSVPLRTDFTSTWKTSAIGLRSRTTVSIHTATLTNDNLLHAPARNFFARSLRFLPTSGFPSVWAEFTVRFEGVFSSAIGRIVRERKSPRTF